MGASLIWLTPSIEKHPIVEEKQLPNHLRYAYLGEAKLLKTLKENKEAIGWSLADIKGIRPSMCMHMILLEEDSKPTVDPRDS